MGRPRRAPPADFADVFARMGWEARDFIGEREGKNINGEMFKRWVAEVDGKPLRTQRKNYVLGNRLSYLKLRTA